MEEENHMDIVSDPTFWANTGLVAASRLAVLATALWIARLAVHGWTPRRGSKPQAVRSPEPKRSHAANPVPMKRAPERPVAQPRYIDLNAPRPKRPVTEATRTEDAKRREHLQNRLMEYIDQRASERTHS